MSSSVSRADRCNKCDNLKWLYIFKILTWVVYNGNNIVDGVQYDQVWRDATLVRSGNGETSAHYIRSTILCIPIIGCNSIRFCYTIVILLIYIGTDRLLRVSVSDA